VTVTIVVVTIRYVTTKGAVRQDARLSYRQLGFLLASRPY